MCGFKRLSGGWFPPGCIYGIDTVGNSKVHWVNSDGYRHWGQLYSRGERETGREKFTGWTLYYTDTVGRRGNLQRQSTYNLVKVFTG